LSVLCCQVEVSATSSRGVIPTLERRFVWSKNFVSKEAIARAGLQSQRK
jgi:hypothetical protein